MNFDFKSYNFYTEYIPQTKRKKCLKKEHHEYRCDADHEGSNCDHNNIIIFANYSEFWHCNLQMAHF